MHQIIYKNYHSNILSILKIRGLNPQLRIFDNEDSYILK